MGCSVSPRRTGGLTTRATISGRTARLLSNLPKPVVRLFNFAE